MSFVETLARHLAEESGKVRDAASHTSFEVDDLRDELQHLRRELASLSRTARRAGARALQDGMEYAEEGAEGAARAVRNHPGTALAFIAACYLTHRLFRNR